jgi:hypothetical protein
MVETTPGAPSARNVLAHIGRLQELRRIGLSTETGRRVHQNHLLRLALEGAQTTVYHLRDFEAQRRYATCGDPVYGATGSEAVVSRANRYESCVTA